MTASGTEKSERGRAAGDGSLLRKAAGQGALLFSGFAAAQALSFGRNALIGHSLSKGDFGVAATLTLMLQLVETLTDLGADRLIVQDRDGDNERLVASAHGVLILRGLVNALALYLAAGPLTQLLGIEHARGAFEAIALVPLIKGLMHLDSRCAQRRLDNGPQLLIEVVPQAAALAATVPALAWAGGYEVIVWLSLVQAATGVLVSMCLAERSYAVGFEASFVRRLVAFGWPIWLSALPLLAVYQGDRMLVGGLMGMDVLAGYSAAFMLTMVPGLLAAKIGQSLMLPLLAEARDNSEHFRLRFAALSEATSAGAALYLSTFVLIGGIAVPLAFGSQYTGLGTLTSLLALMWALRMLQSVPGMALMSAGVTRPFLVAGLLRALALGPAAYVAVRGGGVDSIAAAGVVGEIVSLVYVALRLDRLVPGLAHAFLVRSSFLVPAGVLSVALATYLPTSAGVPGIMGGAVVATMCLAVLAARLLPGVQELAGVIVMSRAGRNA